MEEDKTQKKTLDEIIEETLENSPIIEGYTIKQIAEMSLDTPLTIQPRSTVEQMEIGRAKILTLKKKKEDSEK